ncbi:aminopeptidase P N-terminal domain-containing protein [Cryobacterium breve]|uniref:Aminopeptidase P N-terminal domain-containing protein n=1 Tax=Cryobacterium breve TaxID=1259258 RepID=A0ABY7NB54_9MICO|nr:aminopeptidase P N-terminal domain-containing protein [Cryobacterium breve]
MATSTETAPTVTAKPRPNENRSTTPGSDGFKSYISSGWAERTDTLPPAREQAPFAAARRARVSAMYPGQRLIVPAGRLKQRSNDTDYAFRAHSAFSHLTGWGSDSEPGAVLVLEPTSTGHDATLYFRERAGRDSDEFYANADIGEFWIGPRPSIAQVASDLGIDVRGIADLDSVLRVVDTETLVIREADPAFTVAVDEGRLRFAADKVLGDNATNTPFSLEVNGEHEADDRFARDLSEPAPRERLLRDRPDAPRNRGHRTGLRGRHSRPAPVELPRTRGTPRRRRLQHPRACRRQHRRLRHDRGLRPARVHPALDPQRRPAQPRRPDPARRGHRGRQLLHSRRDPHPPRRRYLLPRAAPRVRGCA